MLELENVHKSFKHDGNLIHVLKGIELTIGRGEGLAITGASGVGKSTLLNVMGTLEPPTRGAVRFDKKNVTRMEEQELCQMRNRHIGFVFQFHHLLPELNALENTIIPAMIARTNRFEATKRASELLSKIGLGERLTHRIGELSGGEQQRVAVARALIMRPRILLADEPTGNLDKATGEGIGDLLSQINQEEKIAMVIVTHNQRLAEKMSRRMELSDGQLN
jgi:lipoprotein-releasing system ATP-binding protein